MKSSHPQVRRYLDSEVIRYTTRFKKQWEGSLKGFVVETLIKTKGGEVSQQGDWITVEGGDEIMLLSKIDLSFELPVNESTDVRSMQDQTYESLLNRHAEVHGEVFSRFSLSLGTPNSERQTPEELFASSSVGNLNPKLVEQLCEAARYELISSTGALPPTLQGIWGGTWLPAWSGDFTLNGNVPTAIASGLNTNFQEVTEAYLDYMYGMFEEFRANAEGLFGAPGIFVPSRSSSSGSTYHFAEEYPHLFWFAGNSWTAHFFYEYWKYTGDQDFLTERAIPFMTASMDFYEFILTKDESGKFQFIPSYSPELGPKNDHPLAINATMDIAGLKQLIRNLLTLVEQGHIETDKVEGWRNILENLPDYAIDDSGDLKEWIREGYENDNAHRHVSHLYPLFYEVDSDFQERPELIEAAKTAIENRLDYRRPRNGAEMAFGLAQIGLAASHIGDTDHAYECVDYLCHSYWSPAFTSYHDPMEIFNVDIAGGLPALVTEMLVQSSADQITILPTLPEQWATGAIKGVLTRCGVSVDVSWEQGMATQVSLKALRDTRFTLNGFDDKEKSLSMSKGEVQQL